MDSAAKEWIEYRLGWLNNEFASNVFVDKPIILPTPEFFPDPYDHTYASLRAMLDRVCEYMGVDANQVGLELFRKPAYVGLVNQSGQPLPWGAAGTYSRSSTEDKSVVRINTEFLHDPMSLVGTMAHELAHVRLMGEERVSGDDFDNELLTDLTATFLGFGVFLANQPRAWPAKMKCWPGSELKRPEYMSAPMYAYTLAHIAWHRDESKPDWVRHLRPGPRANFHQGLRYLRLTKDSGFLPLWL